MKKTIYLTAVILILISMIAMVLSTAFADACNSHTTHNGNKSMCESLEVKYGTDGVTESYRYAKRGALTAPKEKAFTAKDIINVFKQANNLRKEVM